MNKQDLFTLLIDVSGILTLTRNKLVTAGLNTQGQTEIMDDLIDRTRKAKNDMLAENAQIIAESLGGPELSPPTIEEAVRELIHNAVRRVGLTDHGNVILSGDALTQLGLMP